MNVNEVESHVKKWKRKFVSFLFGYIFAKTSTTCFESANKFQIAIKWWNTSFKVVD